MPKSEICKLQTCYYNHPWSQLERGCPLPISPLSAGWLQGWAMSTYPRHPGGLAHPHWQCVDWQLGTDELEFLGELDSSHPGALRLVAHPPLCLASHPLPYCIFPLSFLSPLPRAQILESLPFSPTPALEAVAAEVELDAPKKNSSWSPQC